eukprot:6207656-Pleurochrysis_carterae.AAC.1
MQRPGLPRRRQQGAAAQPAHRLTEPRRHARLPVGGVGRARGRGERQPRRLGQAHSHPLRPDVHPRRTRTHAAMKSRASRKRTLQLEPALRGACALTTSCQHR